MVQTHTDKERHTTAILPVRHNSLFVWWCMYYDDVYESMLVMCVCTCVRVHFYVICNRIVLTEVDIKVYTINNNSLITERISSISV